MMAISFLVTCEECSGTFNINKIIFGYCTKCFIKKDTDDLSEYEAYYMEGYDEGYKIGHYKGYSDCKVEQKTNL